MKRQALEDLRAAIEANTKQRSLDELRAEGKRNVRIVSGERVFRIIEAIVHDIIAQEVGEITERDRDRIVRRTQEEFDRVLGMQAKQDGLIRGQRDLLEEYKRRIARLDKRLSEDRERVEELSRELRGRELELERLRGERETLRGELDAARERSGESQEMSALRDELTRMSTVLRVLEERSAAAEEALIERLMARETAGAHEMEERFSRTLEDALDRITKTMEAATAKPIDVAIEATDVLVDKLFDAEDEMDTNLDRLEVEERTSRAGIARNLDKLRKLRARDEEPAKPKPPRRGRGTGTETVSDESARKMRESMDRLKSVRANAPAERTEEE